MTRLPTHSRTLSTTAASPPERRTAMAPESPNDARQYEADSDGRVYGVFENGEVLPLGITVPALASRSEITREQFNDAVGRQMRGG
jgi:hypothetical protein